MEIHDGDEIDKVPAEVIAERLQEMDKHMIETESGKPSNIARSRKQDGSRAKPANQAVSGHSRLARKDDGD